MNPNARQGREPGGDVVVELPLRLQAQPGGPTSSVASIFSSLPFKGLAVGEALPRGRWAVGLTLVAAVGLAAVVGTAPIPSALVILAATGVLVGAFLTPPVALAALLFSIPFQPWTKVGVGQLTVTATDGLVALLLASWLAQGVRERRVRVSLPPTLLAALVLFWTALLSTQGVDDLPAAIGELVKLVEMIAVGVYAASALNRARDVRFALGGLALAAATEAAVALGQSMTGEGPSSFALGPFVRAYGDFAQPNALAGYLGMALPLTVVLCTDRSAARPIFIVAAMLVGTALLATFSRGAWVGTAVGFALMALVWSPSTRRALLGASFALVIVVTVAVAGLLPEGIAERFRPFTENFVVFDATRVRPDPSNWSVIERMAHWQAGWAMAMDHPIVGVGPGNYEAAYARYFLPGWPYGLGHAHNLYLNMFAELGAIGAVAFLVFTGSVFVRVAQGIRSTAASVKIPPPPLRGRVGVGGSFSWPVVSRSGMMSDPSLRRAVLIGTLGAAASVATHNIFDNIFVHGMGVQFGLILGMMEATARGWTAEATADVRTSLVTDQ